MRAMVACTFLILVTRTAVADQAWGLAVDSKGRVYVVVDQSNERAKLLRVDPDGTKVVLDERAFIREVRLDENDVPSVIRIERGGDSGSLLTVGAKGGARTFFQKPTVRGYWGQFALADDGAIYYGGDLKIMAVRRGGRPYLVAGGKHGTADGQGEGAEFYQVNGMAWGPDKALYVADADAVRRVAPNGAVTTLTRKLMDRVPGDYPRGHPPRSRAVAVDKDGAVYVAMEILGRISKVAPDGEISVAARFEDGWEPHGVAIHDGRIYATEYKWNVIKYEGPRVRVFEPGGASRVLADLSEHHKRIIP